MPETVGQILFEFPQGLRQGHMVEMGMHQAAHAGVEALQVGQASLTEHLLESSQIAVMPWRTNENWSLRENRISSGS